jgi:hypothetical protein
MDYLLTRILLWFVAGVVGVIIHYLRGGLSSTFSSRFKWDIFWLIIVCGPIGLIIAAMSLLEEIWTSITIWRKMKEETQRVKKIKPVEKQLVHSRSTGLPFEKDN